MNDVLPECGGYLPVRIDKYGYMRYSDAHSGIVHRETRDLHKLSECRGSFVDAKAYLHAQARNDTAILELTLDGGGAFVWMQEDRQQKLGSQLAKFHSCYGRWPIRILNA